MSPRTRSTFAKRQKEQARQEKQRAKAQRRLQRKLESQTRVPGEDSGAIAETGLPTDLQLHARPEAPSEPSSYSTSNTEI